MKITFLILGLSMNLLADSEFGRSIYSKESETPDAVTISGVSVNGSGCNSTNTAISLTDDKKTLSILFDEMNITLGPDKRYESKNCNVDVKFRVPPSLKLAVVQMDFRGYSLLPYDSRAFVSNAFYMGSRRFSYSKKAFYGPLDEDFQVQSTAKINRPRFGRCGQDTTIRMRTTLTGVTNEQRDDLILSLDSIDGLANPVKSVNNVHLIWKACK